MAAKKKENKRPPIVTVMGHVDHGKTTLLDAIRSAKQVEKEHGGITQHIGAYQVEKNGEKITFIDTPGHAAFSKMRQRGASVTDIVILVVAANDGVKPQTVESIRHIKEASVPVIVAINKVDIPEASPEMVKAQLTEHEIFVENYGGNTPVVEVSALKGKGIDELLEIILLSAELEEITADEKGELEAIVIESEKDKHRGPVGTVVVKNGSLKPQQTVYIKDQEFKVKALIDEHGKRVNQALPGKPVEVMGFNQVPKVGAIVRSVPQEPQEIVATPASTPQLELDESVDLNIILKADTTGTLEAVRNSIADEISLIETGVGPITESDVLLAQTTNADIFGFNVSVSSSAKKLAKIEGITIKTFNIIYELLETLEKWVLHMMEPTLNQEELGVAEVLEIFEINGEKIAGCKVKTGEISKKHPANLIRDKEIVKPGVNIKTIQREKDSVEAVKAGNECGISLRGRVDIKVGDMIQSYKIIEEI